MGTRPRKPLRKGEVVDLQGWRSVHRDRPSRRRSAPADGPTGASDRPRLVDLLGIDPSRRRSRRDDDPAQVELEQQAREVIEHRLQAALGSSMTRGEWRALARANLSPQEALSLLRRVIPHVDAVITELVDELRRDLDLWVEAVRKGGFASRPGGRPRTPSPGQVTRFSSLKPSDE